MTSLYQYPGTTFASRRTADSRNGRACDYGTRLAGEVGGGVDTRRTVAIEGKRAVGWKEKRASESKCIYQVI